MGKVGIVTSSTSNIKKSIAEILAGQGIQWFAAVNLLLSSQRV
jgi:NAD(P)-dependent dehydrogenase (short-subunit alcohol dehydrogenase family)